MSLVSWLSEQIFVSINRASLEVYEVNDESTESRWPSVPYFFANLASITSIVHDHNNHSKHILTM